jgi:hypothetical protein
MTTRRTTGHHFGRLVVLGLFLALIATVGCKRSPEDLEAWRDARGGMDQLSEWASSDRESLEVRIRALQILIEEIEGDRVPRILDRVDDPELRQQLADGAMGGVETLWGADDIPEFTEELRTGGGTIVIGKAALGKDIAFQLHPYVGPEQRERVEEILREWMSVDPEFRTQLGGARIPALVPRAGDGAIELLTDWIKTADDPREVVAQLRQNVTDEAQNRVIDRAVVERALDEYPEVSREVQHAVVEARTDEVVPILEKVILEGAVDDFLQGSLDTLVKVQGEEAGEFLSRVIVERFGVVRWAAANALIDARDDAGLVDIARALPTEPDPIEAVRHGPGDDDTLKRYFTQVCNYYGIAVERRELEGHVDSLREVLAIDTWPAQVLFLLCTARTKATELVDEVAGLRSSRVRLRQWGGRIMIGEIATEVHELLQE